MYFTGLASEDISFHDSSNNCLKIKPDIYSQVVFDQQRDVRVFLDTHLLKFGRLPNE